MLKVNVRLNNTWILFFFLGGKGSLGIKKHANKNKKRKLKKNFFTRAFFFFYLFFFLLSWCCAFVRLFVCFVERLILFPFKKKRKFIFMILNNRGSNVRKMFSVFCFVIIFFSHFLFLSLSRIRIRKVAYAGALTPPHAQTLHFHVW